MPFIDARAEVDAGRLRRGARRFDSPLLYDHRRLVSPYGELMRTWKGFEARDALYDHVIRYLPRDFALFSRMDQGDQYPQAYRHAHDMFEERLAEERLAGNSIDKGSAAYEALRREIVPPYDAGKFPNKWRKMWPDQPARTLMAHLGKDGYSHIHYDSAQARTISVREAARLQSFPDGFRFCGTMNPAFPTNRERGSTAVGESPRGRDDQALATAPMMDKLALKRLTASDLTFFEWHFKNRNVGNQKAINLNADVFSDQLYPALENHYPGTPGQVGYRSLDCWTSSGGTGQSATQDHQRCELQELALGR